MEASHVTADDFPDADRCPSGEKSGPAEIPSIDGVRQCSMPLESNDISILRLSQFPATSFDENGGPATRVRKPWIFGVPLNTETERLRILRDKSAMLDML